MTSVYFVRHAQPDHDWKDDSTRPLTSEGNEDSQKVCKVLRYVKLDCAYSSPYLRSVDTIRNCAAEHGLEIVTDEDFRERRKGSGGNVYGMFQKRWADFEFAEDGGENLRETQERNVNALFRILDKHCGENVLIGTHGTALSTILNYFDNNYGCDDFLRMIDFMPYIIRLDFEGRECVGKEEILIVKKEYKGRNRADKK